MTPAQPEVSIIVPCYNQAHYLQTLLASVSRATRHPHEVLIVNDGSTSPSTSRYLERLEPACANQTMILINKENGGLASARNTGIARSKGARIQFLDADDLLLPDSIDDRLDLLASTKNEVAISDYIFCNGESNQFWPPEKNTISQENLNFYGVARYWERGLSIPIHCGLFNRDVLPKQPFHSGLRAKEDWIFWMSLFLRTKNVIRHSLPGCVYRMHGSNMTRDGRLMAISWIDAILTAKELFPQFDEFFVREAMVHFRSFYIPYFWERDGWRFVELAFDAFITSNCHD